MSDYFAQLETHLLAAARRRSVAFSWRRPAVAVALAVAVAATVAAAIALLPGPRDDERSAAPPGAVVPLASGERAAPCDAEPVPVPVTAPPDAVTGMLGVLRRMPHAHDALPPLGYGAGPHDTSQWLPVGTLDPRAVRLTASGTGRTPVHVVPTTAILREAPACAEPRSRGAGACLVSVDGPPGTRCFTTAQIRAGRAFMLATGSATGARLVGLVPDGVSSATVTVRGRTYELPAVDNMVQRYVSRLRTGDRARVVLNRVRPGCGERVARALTAALPVLGEPAVAAVPAGLSAYEADGTRLLQDAARIAGGGDGVTYWVVPAAAPGADPCAPVRRACAFAQGPGGDVLPGSACGTAARGGWRDAWVAAPFRGRTLFYALAGADTTAVRVGIGGRTAHAELNGGVAMGVLDLPWRDTGGVRVRYERGDASP